MGRRNVLLLMIVIGVTCYGWASAAEERDKHETTFLLKRLLAAAKAADTRDGPPYVDRRCSWYTCRYQTKAKQSVPVSNKTSGTVTAHDTSNTSSKTSTAAIVSKLLKLFRG